MSQKKKTTAQSKRPRKAPSNQTGGTAWGKKAAAAISGKMQSADVKKLILLNFPYIIAFYMVEKAAWLYRHCNGDTIVDRLMVLFMNFGLAYKSYLPSFHPFDLLVGLIGAAALKAVIYFKGKNAKKYRQGEEYGSARWGNAKDMEPFIDPVFENNVLLTQTERLMMSGRPKHPKYARNKNVIVIGGSGSGKTRFFVKPNLMQMPEKVSYVCTDPKGTIIIECGKMLSDAGYKIKVLNTINFKKSMHYNPFHYIRSEKDILKLVNTIIANTKGDGEKSGEDFWVKAERLLYCALIGYIYYEAPEEEQNFSTLLEFINASEAREDDEEFKNPADELFEDLEKAKPEHFAVRQYKKYKLAAGKTAKSILISCGARLAPFDIAELRDLMAYDEMELDLLGDRRTALFVIISDTDDTFNFVVSIMYTQLFNLLCDRADDQCGGQLKYHVRNFSTILSPANKRASHLCDSVRRYIDQNCGDDLSLEHLAKFSHVNKYYLVHAFTDEYGISPINYLMHARVKKAEKLLATTDYSLSVISHTCGFSSSSYFSQTFKKVAGVSPSSYRKTVKSDHGEMEDLSR